MLVVVTVTEIVVPFPDCGYEALSLIVIVAVPAAFATTVNVFPDAGEIDATLGFELAAVNVPVKCVSATLND